MPAPLAAAPGTRLSKLQGHGDGKTTWEGVGGALAKA